MARKTHLIDMSVTTLREYKSALYLELAAVTAEEKLREDLTEDADDSGPAWSHLTQKDLVDE